MSGLQLPSLTARRSPALSASQPSHHPALPDGFSPASGTENQSDKPSLGPSLPYGGMALDSPTATEGLDGLQSKESPRLDGSLPVKDPAAAIPQLGFQNNVPSTHHAGYPKVSSNYDKPESSSRPMRPADTIQPSKEPPPRDNLESRKETAKHQTSIPQHTKKVSFADMATRKCAKPPDIFTHNFNAIKPIKMNEGLTIIMPEKMYEQRLKEFQYALIGRLILPQGASPKNADILKGELQSILKTAGDWILMPLGRGFFSLKFNLQEDQLRAARQSSWKLSSGYLMIRDWKPNFDPYKELSSTAQIWVRLFHLPAEYWHPEFLVGVFRVVGNVIKLDGNSAHGLVGHFARALIEVDLTNPLIDTVRVGLPDNLFNVEFSYENISLLCSFCHFVGHSMDKCRKAKASKEEQPDNAENPKPKNTKRARKQWVEKDQAELTENPKQTVPATTPPVDAVHSANHFNVLYDLDDVEDSVDDIHADKPPRQQKRLGSKMGNVNPIAIVDETVPETPIDQLMEMVMTKDKPSNSRHKTQNFEETRARLIEQDRELGLRRALRAEITRNADQRLSNSESSCSNLQIPASQVGQPKSTNIAPNSPHPAHQRIESQLQAAVKMGQQPAAYELDSG